MDASLIKDALGFVGAAVMAVPFFRDHGARKRLKRTKDLRAFFTPFTKALNAAEAANMDNVLAASKLDVTLMLAGLSLLAASFAVGLFTTLSQ